MVELMVRRVADVKSQGQGFKSVLSTCVNMTLSQHNPQFFAELRRLRKLKFSYDDDSKYKFR